MLTSPTNRLVLTGFRRTHPNLTESSGFKTPTQHLNPKELSKPISSTILLTLLNRLAPEIILVILTMKSLLTLPPVVGTQGGQ